MALAAINFIIIGESSIYTADFLLLADGVTAGSLQAYAIFLFYSLPSERDNCFFSSLDSMFNPPCAVSHSSVVLQTAEHCFFSNMPQTFWSFQSRSGSRVVWHGWVCSVMGVTSLTRWVTGVLLLLQRHSKTKITHLMLFHEFHSQPAGLCVKRGQRGDPISMDLLFGTIP